MKSCFPNEDLSTIDTLFNRNFDEDMEKDGDGSPPKKYDKDMEKDGDGSPPKKFSCSTFLGFSNVLSLFEDLKESFLSPPQPIKLLKVLQYSNLFSGQHLMEDMQEAIWR
jgi:hypothetical protein